MGQPTNNSNRSSKKERVARLFESIAVISLFYILSLGWWVPVDMIIKLSPEKLLSPEIAELSFAASGIFYWILLLIVSYALSRRWQTILPIIRQTAIIWLLVFLAFISITWSINPKLTLLRSVSLAGTTCFGVFFSFRYRLEQQLQIVAFVIITMAIISLLLITVVPSEAIMHGVHEGAWRGTFFHKNFLGKNMVIGMLAVLMLNLVGKIRPLFTLGGAGLCAVLIVGSQSVTSIVTAVACVLLFMLFSKLETYPGGYHRLFMAISFLVIGALVATLLYANIDSVLQVFGRKTTLTGRTQLWAILLDKAMVKPWLGYGYAAFWQGRAGVSGEVTEAFGNWYPTHAHNGFMDLLLDFGLVGLLVFISTFAVIGFRAYKLAIQPQSNINLWPATYMFFFMIHNLAESDLFRPLSIMWPLFVAAAIQVLGRDSKANYVSRESTFQ